MSKTIDEETVVHLAELARITLSDKEKKEFAKQLSNILEFFSQISELDTENVKPTYHVLELKNVFREDEPREGLSQEAALKNAPQKERGYFKSPKIVED
nr:Asp-tRNA(Asn)/Glu-tRNA(Gln) amidotransferase subunit GatC [Candidatus Sigynarchaeum springense]MDO8117023.1 Asp-tRNA(Asn)/Glu-tRNA(Gln) amidotransferase subunit GatC [Candidatus Sigynarchaeota archaeon]